MRTHQHLLRFYIGFSLTGLGFQGRSGAAQSSFLRVDFSQQGGFVLLRLLRPLQDAAFDIIQSAAAQQVVTLISVSAAARLLHQHLHKAAHPEVRLEKCK